MKKIVFILSLILSNFLLADSFVVLVPKLIGAEENLKQVLQELIIYELKKSGHSVVKKKTKNTYNLESTLMKLNKSYLLTFAIEDDKNRIKKMKLKNFDDIDTVVSRLMKSLLNNTSIQKSMDVTDVTKQEQDNRNRKLKVDRLWIVGLGTSFLKGMDANSAYNTTFGYIWGIESYFDLFVRLDLSNAEGSSNAGLTQFVIGGNYYFNNSIHAPFFGAHFGYASADSEVTEGFFNDTYDVEKDGKGWALGLGGGMKFFRASSVNFGIEARYTFVTKDLVNKKGISKPGQLAISFLIFF